MKDIFPNLRDKSKNKITFIAAGLAAAALGYMVYKQTPEIDFYSDNVCHLSEDDKGIPVMKGDLGDCSLIVYDKRKNEESEITNEYFPPRGEYPNRLTRK
ncbi:hypothetical protein HY448_02600 [Candidatus Pacearchaeota archaeon]|nr:hypothetical protein [Candidatus Pacearchaeota archaeon]